MLKLVEKTFYTVLLSLLSAGFCTGNSSVEPTLQYGSNIADWSLKAPTDRRDVLFSMVFFDATGKTVYREGRRGETMQTQIRHLDVFKYWGEQREKKYLVVATKTAYRIDAPPRFFNDRTLADIEFLRRTVGDYVIRPVSPRTFKIEGTMFSPSFTYDLDFVYHPETPERYRDAIEYTLSEDPALGRPFLTAVQHNYDYGRVLFHKTTEMSVSFTNYYATRDGQTLIVVHTLNYLHNIPPDFIGGEKMLVNEIKEMILDYVTRIRQVCAADNRKLSMAR